MSNSGRFLLDTNILSHIIRDPRDTRVTRRIEQVGEEHVFTSIIVASELRFGAKKRGSRRLSDQVEAVLSAIDVEPFDVPADYVYAEVRCELEGVGKPIGPNDLLIAAHALAFKATLVTANFGEFERVNNLEIENWL